MLHYGLYEVLVRSYMFLLNCIFFRSPKYYQSYALQRPVLVQLFIIACRGVIGGFLLYMLTVFLGLGLRWEMVIHSGWTYLVMFLLGFGLIHLILLAYLILLPLQWMGYLKPIIDWIMNAIIILLFLVFYVISEIVSVFKPKEA